MIPTEDDNSNVASHVLDEISVEDIAGTVGFFVVVSFGSTLGYFRNIGIPYLPDFSDSLKHYAFSFFYGLTFYLERPFTIVFLVSMIIIWRTNLGIYRKFYNGNRDKQKIALLIIVPTLAILYSIGWFFDPVRMPVAFAQTILQWCAVGYAISYWNAVNNGLRKNLKTLAMSAVIISLLNFTLMRLYAGRLYAFNELITVTSNGEAQLRRVMWSDQNYLFVAKCPKNLSWEMEAFQNGVKSFGVILDEYRHSAVCNSEFREERERSTFENSWFFRRFTE